MDFLKYHELYYVLQIFFNNIAKTFKLQSHSTIFQLIFNPMMNFSWLYGRNCFTIECECVLGISTNFYPHFAKKCPYDQYKFFTVNFDKYSYFSMTFLKIADRHVVLKEICEHGNKRMSKRRKKKHTWNIKYHLLSRKIRSSNA